MSVGCGQDEDSDTAESGCVFPEELDTVIFNTEERQSTACTTQSAYIIIIILFLFQQNTFATYIDLFPIDMYTAARRTHITHIVGIYRPQTHLQDRRPGRVVPWCRATSGLDQRPEWHDAGYVSVFAEEIGVHVGV